MNERSKWLLLGLVAVPFLLVATRKGGPEDPLDRIVGQQTYLDTRVVRQKETGYVYERKLTLVDKPGMWLAIDKALGKDEWREEGVLEGTVGPTVVFTSLRDPNCSITAGWDDGVITPLTETRPARISEVLRANLRNLLARL